MTGRVWLIFSDQAYAFLKTDELQPRTVFLFHNGMQATSVGFASLKVGTRVEFTEIDHPKGPRAIECRTI